MKNTFDDSPKGNTGSVVKWMHIPGNALFVKANAKILYDVYKLIPTIKVTQIIESVLFKKSVSVATAALSLIIGKEGASKMGAKLQTLIDNKMIVQFTSPQGNLKYGKIDTIEFCNGTDWKFKTYDITKPYGKNNNYNILSFPVRYTYTEYTETQSASIRAFVVDDAIVTALTGAVLNGLGAILTAFVGACASAIAYYIPQLVFSAIKSTDSDSPEFISMTASEKSLTMKTGDVQKITFTNVNGKVKLSSVSDCVNATENSITALKEGKGAVVYKDDSGSVSVNVSVEKTTAVVNPIDDTTPPDSSSPSSGSSGSKTNVVMWVAIVVVIAVVAFFVFKKGKK